MAITTILVSTGGDNRDDNNGNLSECRWGEHRYQ